MLSAAAAAIIAAAAAVVSAAGVSASAEEDENENEPENVVAVIVVAEHGLILSSRDVFSCSRICAICYGWEPSVLVQAKGASSPSPYTMPPCFWALP